VIGDGTTVDQRTNPSGCFDAWRRNATEFVNRQNVRTGESISVAFRSAKVRSFAERKTTMAPDIDSLVLTDFCRSLWGKGKN
jgi:hypothetical protein